MQFLPCPLSAQSNKIKKNNTCLIYNVLGVLPLSRSSCTTFYGKTCIKQYTYRLESMYNKTCNMFF